MSARRRKAAVVVVAGVAPLALTALATAPAFAHGSMTDPVSRISACFAEGPENPDSAACKALVAAGGTQPLYDWNEVNIADAAGNHQQVIPDGKLCSAGRDKYKGLDLPRADWPSSPLSAGNHTFRYKATAPHKGSFELYVTKDAYDPTQPLKWSDLEEKPFAKVTDPQLTNGEYVFDATVPAKSGRHLIYSIWQRSDSPEAFYTCSDVVFGKDTGGSGAGSGSGSGSAPAPAASAPSDQEIKDGADESSVDHNGHGGDSGDGGDETSTPTADTKAATGSANAPETNDASDPVQQPAGGSENLAETGGDNTTPYIAVGGAAALAVGAAAVLASVRRRGVTGGRHSR